MSTHIRSVYGEDIESGSLCGHVGDTERNISQIDARLEKISDGGNNISSVAKVVDIDKWANCLKSILEEVPHYMCSPGHPGRICRIPQNLREVDIKAYEPCYLSIGPYHQGKPSLQRMEKTKLVVLKCFLEQNPNLLLKEILKEIKTIEPEARRFYSDIDMTSEKFVQMLLLDSLYLVIVFCGMPKSLESKNHINTKRQISMQREEVNLEGICSIVDSEDGEIIKGDDQSTDNETGEENNINGPAWFWNLLMHDLFLLENQLPFFVLQKMYDLAYVGSETTLIASIKFIIHDLLSEYIKLDSEMVILPEEGIHHLLHLCHLFFRPTFQQDLTTCETLESSQMFRLGSAVQLSKAGVIFEPRSCDTQHSLIDITFNSSGKMVVPCLHVDDNTSTLLKNLIALEQMKYPQMGLNVSAYTVFLLHLITTPTDVKLLRKKGIIQHHLASDKEMMVFINQLSVGLAFDYVEDRYSLKPVFHELKRFSSKRVPRWRAWLKHKYFSNPWTTISLMAATLLLLLSALQTFYAVYSFYHPIFYGHT